MDRLPIKTGDFRYPKATNPRASGSSATTLASISAAWGQG